MTYGTETYCTDRLRPGRLVTGPRVVGQALYRRLTTPRGMLRGGDEEQAYGDDLSEYVGHSDPRTAAAALPGIVRSAALKDPRIADVQTEVLLTQEGPAFELLITIIGYLHDSEETFTLVVSVTDVTIKLLGLE